jgi:hypothetical protein
MNNEIFWLVTLVILCIGFSIQPLRALWRKLRPIAEAPSKNRTKPVYTIEQRQSILDKYKVPSSYLGYLSHLNNEELEEWAKEFFSAGADRDWQ